jgi:hypothetical protein
MTGFTDYLCKLKKKKGYEFAEANNVKYPLNKSARMAGKKGAYQFEETYNFILRCLQHRSIAWVTGFKTLEVNKFIQNLAALCKYRFPPNAILFTN